MASLLPLRPTLPTAETGAREHAAPSLAAIARPDGAQGAGELQSRASTTSAGGQRWVVNVASAAGFAPAPSMSAYAASKHAVVGLSEVLAMELEGSGVRVLMVCPGVINTPIAPREVAEALLRALGRGDIVVFAGPLARMSSILMRISRRFSRRVTLRKAREMGYL